MTRYENDKKLRAKYFKKLEQFISTVFNKAAKLEHSYTSLADEAGLTPKTVENLSTGITRYPQYLTIEKLASAVGMEMSLTLKRLAVANQKRTWKTSDFKPKSNLRKLSTKKSTNKGK